MGKTALVLPLVVLASTISWAGEQQTAKGNGFWDTLKKKIETLAPARKTAETTAVGGVRGIKGTAADSLYWKEDEKETRMSDAEITSFRTALDEAEQGKAKEALGHFEEFLRSYPQSRLKEDAARAIEELKAGR